MDNLLEHIDYLASDISIRYVKNSEVIWFKTPDIQSYSSMVTCVVQFFYMLLRSIYNGYVVDDWLSLRFIKIYLSSRILLKVLQLFIYRYLFVFEHFCLAVREF